MSGTLSSAALFSADELVCVRGGREVFAGLSFALAPGEVLVLRGPNGSGKSSLLRLLAGFLPPAAGQIAWASERVALDPAAHRARLHHIGHSDAVKGPLTTRENLAFAAALSGAPAGAAAAGLDGFDLTALADVPARHLSAGQKRRLALARLLAVPRPLWLLDEPGVGLDAANRERLERALAGHRAGGGIAVLATHGDVAVENALALDLGVAERAP
ncbi:MAG TPA: heme ABC exporter ATP-binding protein CcmA [Geminicoccaceae bacterium]|nr:heme ABC exporter ATP-binding protein CcmA [Geminicoccaceae bacterium]